MYVEQKMKKNKKTYLSAVLRNLPSVAISDLSEAEILILLKNARWGNSQCFHTIQCPRCQITHKAYFISSRKQWQCKHCQHRFSVKSGTIFQHTKLSLRKLLLAVYYFTINSKGISALNLSRHLGVQYKTSWALLHKLREAIEKTQDFTPLTGIVHIDGCYVNHYIRPKNFKHRRIDRRKKRYQRKDKACVMVFRQQAANQEIIKGADRTLVALVKEENADDTFALTHRLVAPNSTICADENPAYDGLAFHYDLWRVNHSQEYRSVDGITNNLAESFFARFRRMIMGVYHKMGNHYMLNYANEAAWREDFRYQSDKDKFDNVLKRCLKARPSRDLTGYWQGNKKPTAKFGLESLCLEASNDNHYLAVA